MSYSPIAGDLIQSVQHFRNTTKDALIIRHWKVVAKFGTGADIADVAQTLDDAFNSAWDDLMADTASKRTTFTQAFDAATDLPKSLNTEAPTPTIVTGAIAGGILPGQVAGLVTLLTDTPGKSYRGRFYMPFPSESSCDEGNTTSGYRSDLATLAALYVNSYTVGDLTNGLSIQGCIYSRHLHIMTITTGYRTGLLFGTQRRRRRDVL